VNAGTTYKGDNPIAGLDLTLATLSVGDYGFDSVSNTAWVVLNHASDFSVLVPEPGMLSLLATGLLGLLAYAWRKRK
jgi:hypothetical protein